MFFINFKYIYTSIFLSYVHMKNVLMKNVLLKNILMKNIFMRNILTEPFISRLVYKVIVCIGF